MKEQKGIFRKTLIIAGAVLVSVGVFVFQGLSRAEDTTTGGSGNVGVTLDPELNSGNEGAGDAGTGEEGEEDCVPVECEEGDDACVPVECDENNNGEENGNTGEGEEDCVPVECEEGDDACVPVECEENNNGEENNGEEEEKVLKVFALRYNANGGTGAPSAQVCESYEKTCGFVVADSVPTREGYEFRGWAKDGDTNDTYQPRATVTSSTPDEPLTMYAVWAEIKTYTLMYDVNGGSGAPEVQACKSANGKCSFVVSGATPSRTGFEFLNWLRGDETYVGGNEIVVTESITILIANYNPIYNFTLEYTSDEGTENLPEPQKCETTMGTCTFIVATKEPTRAGYEFLGWRFEDQPDMRAKAGDELVVAIDGPLDLKIQAVWSRIYSVLNSGEMFGAGERVVLRSSAGYNGFKKLTIDEVEVPMEYFVVSEGETTSIVLSNAFSQSLNIGEHAFIIEWEDGKASGLISVSQNEDGTKRFVIVDASGNTDKVNLMYRPKAGAVSKESTGAASDSATDNNESNFDAVRTLVLVAVAAFVVIYIVNRFYVKHKMSFIEEF